MKDTIRKELYSVFDINPDTPLKGADTDLGFLGFFNRLSRRKRNNLFWKKIRSKAFQNHPKRKIILAEGDSWFEYPLFLREIIDRLNMRPHYAIYSIASGGDWLANMLREKEYIEELSLLQPDVFLMSGGGNDLLGDCRLAKLLRKKGQKSSPPFDEATKKYFSREFFRLLENLKRQYLALLEQIEASPRFREMKIITHGYDYPIPDRKKGWNIAKHITRNGSWLKTPLELRGYYDQQEQNTIMKYLIDHFNQMLIGIAQTREQVHHIDLRGIVDKPNLWFDELHPSSQAFKTIALRYEEVIDEGSL